MRWEFMEGDVCVYGWMNEVCIILHYTILYYKTIYPSISHNESSKTQNPNSKSSILHIYFLIALPLHLITSHLIFPKKT